jgi:hypothetical protein
MSVTVVNGYLCTTCSEAAKARNGQDPHAPSPTNPNASSDTTQTPAVVYGGSLTGQNAVAQSGAANASPPPTLDILA